MLPQAVLETQVHVDVHDPAAAWAVGVQWPVTTEGHVDVCSLSWSLKPG